MLTYKELFERVTKDIENVEYDVQYPVKEKLYVNTPDNQKTEIFSVVKKRGEGFCVLFEDGKELHGEKNHLILTSKGFEPLYKAIDYVDEKLNIVKIKDSVYTDETEFYDISIPFPHAYVGPNGIIHHNTAVVFQKIKEKGLVDGVDYIKYSGKATASSLYQTLFKWRKGGLIVFDDLDSVWKDGDATNLLKAALDSYDERIITWLSGRTVDISRMSKEEREEFYDNLDAAIDEDPSDSKIKYPSMFPFAGRIIFISNLQEKEFDTAILSRSAKINMTITQDQVLERMRSILPTLGGTDVDLDKKNELLDHLTDLFKKKEINSLTLREFVKGLSIIRSGVPNWKELIEYL